MEQLNIKSSNCYEVFRLLFPSAPKSLICFAVSMVIRWRSPRMGLVQRVISALMYGNGASKQVNLFSFRLFLN